MLSKLAIWFLLMGGYGIMASAQGLVLTNTVRISPFSTVSHDTEGNIYLVLDNGQVAKYGPDGEVGPVFSTPHQREGGYLDAWQPLRMFVFYPFEQEYLFLDRFLAPLARYTVSLPDGGHAVAGAMSAGRQIWWFDAQALSLVKQDVYTQLPIIQVGLEFAFGEESHEVNYMREYQNLLFVNDKASGIMVFDNLGNYLRKITVPGLSFFSFHQHCLYYARAGWVRFASIEEGREPHQDIPLPKSVADGMVLYTGSRLYGFAGDSIKIFGFE